MLGDTGTGQVADGWPPRFSAIWRLNREVCCRMRGQHGTSTAAEGFRIPIKFGGGGYFIVGKRGPRTSSGGPRTRAMVLAAVAAAAAFLGNDRTALMLRHVPHAPLTTGFIVCFANLNAA